MPGYLVYPYQQTLNAFTPTGSIQSTTVSDAIVEVSNDVTAVEGVALLGL